MTNRIHSYLATVLSDIRELEEREETLTPQEDYLYIELVKLFHKYNNDINFPKNHRGY